MTPKKKTDLAAVASQTARKPRSGRLQAAREAAKTKGPNYRRTSVVFFNNQLSFFEQLEKLLKRRGLRTANRSYIVQRASHHLIDQLAGLSEEQLVAWFMAYDADHPDLGADRLPSPGE